MKAPLALGLAALGLLTTGCSMTPTSSSVVRQGRKSGARVTGWGRRQSLRKVQRECVEDYQRTLYERI